MGLFDKFKSKVAEQVGHQQPQQPAYEEPADDLIEEASDDDGGASDDEADDWAGWDPNDWQGMWYRVHQIEAAAQHGGDDAADAKCREYGVRDWAHLRQVRETFARHFGHLHEFTQAALNARNQQTRETLGAAGAANSQIFEPVEGVDLATYAGTQARAASGQDFGAILASIGCDQAKWERVSAEWTRRMSGQAGDMNATMALLTEYGKLFGQAGQGGYGASAAANAAVAGHHNQGSAVGAEPCTLEEYARMGAAQSAWAQQGKDVNAMLAQHFGMNALAWSNVSQYWSAKFQSDYRIATTYGDLLDKYTAEYLQATGGSAADLDADLVI